MLIETLIIDNYLIEYIFVILSEKKTNNDSR